MAEPVQRQAWARLRPEHRQAYPVHYLGQWFRIVERHHPDIPTAPEHIWLDLAGAPQQVTAAHFETAQRTARRILVVDDEVSIRQTLQIALSKAGYEVLQARDGDEAVRLWRDKGPDLIIADIHMPNKSGLLLMQELQESQASSRVIAMTDGGPGRQFNLLGLSALLGAVRSIVKPFTLEEMLDAVDEELRKA